ncbi:MAG: hypothetical protein F6K26_03590 [Moorea sp. SIO2I5]|nr:hypothetical protein [Moorena sp. SIO2I5]
MKTSVQFTNWEGIGKKRYRAFVIMFFSIIVHCCLIERSLFRVTGNGSEVLLYTKS